MYAIHLNFPSVGYTGTESLAFTLPFFLKDLAVLAYLLELNAVNVLENLQKVHHKVLPISSQ